MDEMGPVAQWRKSRRCESSHCVEVAPLGTEIGMRNSQRPELHLTLSPDAWRSFVAGVSAGDFDR
jgi:hypothetical protein